jgi:hypothetical protein
MIRRMNVGGLDGVPMPGESGGEIRMPVDEHETDDEGAPSLPRLGG